MAKSRYDTRSWIEIVGDLVSERTEPGDTITLVVQYGKGKPQVSLNFQTYSPDKKGFPAEQDITDWVDDTPYYEIIDDATGEPAPGEARRGSSNWAEYVDTSFGPLVQKIVQTGGRIFKYEGKK